MKNSVQVRDLPSLRNPRYSHACGTYTGPPYHHHYRHCHHNYCHVCIFQIAHHIFWTELTPEPLEPFNRCKGKSPDSRWRTKRIFFSRFNRALWLSRLVSSSFKVLLNLTSFDSWSFLETRGLSSFAKVSTWSSWHKHFKLVSFALKWRNQK